jgi:hypothetical protein
MVGKNFTPSLKQSITRLQTKQKMKSVPRINWYFQIKYLIVIKGDNFVAVELAINYCNIQLAKHIVTRRYIVQEWVEGDILKIVS